jgi:diacylglycerol kinase family enzyme
MDSNAAGAANLRLINGELHWTSQHSGDQHMSTEQIIFVAPSDIDSSDFIVAGLAESDSPEAPYHLYLLRCPAVPGELIDRFSVVGGFPDYLKKTQVHVIVSTKSGTGLARECWDTVVQPLTAIVERSTKKSPCADSSATESPDPGHGDSNGAKTTEALGGFKVLITDSQHSVRQFARERWGDSMSSDSPETIILLSGDGGIVDLLNGADEAAPKACRPKIAILPLGTGNALFHSLHKPLYSEKGPSPLVAGLRTLFRGRPAPLPVFRANFSPGSTLVSYSEAIANGDDSVAKGEGENDPKTKDKNTTEGENGAKLQRQDTRVDHLLGAIVASYGFHASIVWESDTPEYRKHGEKRFGMVAKELVEQAHAYAARVEIQRLYPGLNSSTSGYETLPREEFGYVLASMVSNLEKSFTISPASKPLDGKLRLVHFGPVSGAKTMEIMAAAYRDGAHVGMTWEDETGGKGHERRRDGVGYSEVAGIRVTVLEKDARWRKVCIDGTIVEVPQDGWMTVETVEGSFFDVVVDPSATGRGGNSS